VTAAIARLTVAALLGRRRGLGRVGLPAGLLVLAVLLKLTQANTGSFAADVLHHLGFAAILPLVALVAGTGAISTEIDDGSIVHLLSKPVSRTRIILVKTVVAFAFVVALGVVPLVLTSFLLAPGEPRLALGFGVAALLAGLTYTAIFVALSVVTGHAVTAGLLYALLWESALGGYVPGARVLSVQQWGLAIVEQIAGSTVVDASVALAFGGAALLLTTTAAVALAVNRLRSLVLSSAA
jgi:ABC-2 type transport system permease protein